MHIPGGLCFWGQVQGWLPQATAAYLALRKPAIDRPGYEACTAHLAQTSTLYRLAAGTRGL